MFQNLFYKLDLPWRYEANNDGGQGNGNNDDGQQGEQGNNQGEPEDFNAWLEGQPDEIKTKAKPLFDAYVSKLTNTVRATRRERDDFSKKLSDASKKLEEGSEARKQLEGLSAQLDEANRKSDFYEQAPSNECRNPRAAYALAVSSNLFTRSGSPDWKAIKEEAPELFGKTTKAPTKKSAGSGTNTEQPSHGTMNDLIRQKAGATFEVTE